MFGSIELAFRLIRSPLVESVAYYKGILLH